MSIVHKPHVVPHGRAYALLPIYMYMYLCIRVHLYNIIIIFGRGDTCLMCTCILHAMACVLSALAYCVSQMAVFAVHVCCAVLYGTGNDE